MKVPPYCPCCHGVLVNQCSVDPDGRIIIKICEKYTNHRFSCHIITSIYGDEVVKASVELDNANLIRAYWWFTSKRLAICKLGLTGKKVESQLYLPFFEPDWSDYHKLINKLKVYAIFS